MGYGGYRLQMSWQGSTVSQKRKAGGPLGLRNLGNSCYLNSVLQCLTYTPPLANFCLRLQHSSLCDSVLDGVKRRECPFCLLEKRIVRSLRSDGVLDAPAKIQSCLRIFAEHFKGGRQEDAHEFLRYVIDACHNTCLRLKKLRRKNAGASEPGNGGATVVKEIFGGALQSQVKCLSCSSESNKVDEIMDISLDVLHSNSLEDAIKRFFQPEILDGNNKYKCENCKKMVAARKQMSILQAPNILVIQLKRFEGIIGEKIDKLITFEEVLLLSSFMCKASKDPQPEYRLFGTIVHSGYSPESGHYYAYIKDALGRWYCCNDSYVTLSALRDVLSEKVYILFFSRTNQRPGSCSTTFASNGVKLGDQNGWEESKTLKAVPSKSISTAAVPSKATLAKSTVEQSPGKVFSAPPKIEKAPSSSQIKFNIFGKSDSKSLSPSSDKKFDNRKIDNFKVNGNAKNLVLQEKAEKSFVTNGNGFAEIEKANAFDSEHATCQSFAVADGKCGIQNGGDKAKRPGYCNGIGTVSKLINGSEVDNNGSHSGDVKSPSDVTVPQGKHTEDSCILLAQDPESRARVEEFKQVLKQDASSVLRSCGWLDNVQRYISSKKRLRPEEDGSTVSGSELKKMLIANAKSTFISQLPESLKEDLIKRLLLFSQEK